MPAGNNRALPTCWANGSKILLLGFHSAFSPPRAPLRPKSLASLVSEIALCLASKSKQPLLKLLFALLWLCFCLKLLSVWNLIGWRTGATNELGTFWAPSPPNPQRHLSAPSLLDHCPPSLLTRTRVSPGALTRKVATHAPLSGHHSICEPEPESAENGFSRSGSQRSTFLPDSPKKQCFAHKTLLNNRK